MPGVIMMAALFALFTIEMYLKAKVGGHSHGGPMGSGTVALADRGARPGMISQQSTDTYNNSFATRGHVEYVEFEKTPAYIR
jgi:hypothetical protein